mmetsp:Transcript_9465/g.12879  ORF Transcript_9465/g.12879 Transcript_9465/m.12879 type:complete len:131 (+) Transcript_9465:33-425(+)
MKFSTFFVIFVLGLVAFAQAAPGDAKTKPVPKAKPKPKPKPRKHSNVVTMAPTMGIDSEDIALDAGSSSSATTLAEAAIVSSENNEAVTQSVGVVAVLCGVAVACVVAIVAVFRAPTTHEPLPQSSEHAV